MDHPRWGIILSVVTDRDVNAGEELFGYYGYKKSEFPIDEPWYFELKMKIDKERRQEAKRKNTKSKRDKAQKNFSNKYEGHIV